MADEVINIDVLDTRLTDSGVRWYCEWTKGGDPEKRILVNGEMPLDRFFEQVKARLKGRRLGVLSLLSHGLGREEYADRERKKVKKLHGGFGIEFCAGNVTLSNVDQFKSLSGLFSSQDVGIKLMGCAAAAEYRFEVAPRSREFQKGFGKQLCRALAKAAQTSVMASDSLQSVQIDNEPRTYRWGGEIDTVNSCVTFGKWEGTVWIFRPDGTEGKSL